MKVGRITYYILAAFSSLLLYSCASIGNPEGGPRDYTPPKFVKSSPAQGALKVKGNKAEIEFDEIVQLKDQMTKVVVSPVQHEPPLIKSLGKKITVEFRDSMKPNTTYSVDFSNAISDINEDNKLDGFSYAFSTGDSIDSLQISGIVLRAKDLEPMQHVLVGIHSNLNDSAFTKLPFDRISRTNDLGQFTLRNLKPGRYHIFALNDMDGDYKMERTEDIAFDDDIIVPSTAQYTSQDTTFTFDRKVDTVVTATHTKYLPNDILLNMFNENYRSLYLKKSSRIGKNKLFVLFSAERDTLPKIKILYPATHKDKWFQLERTAQNDSLVYWLTDTNLVKTDTIVAQLTYLYTDSTNNLTFKTDTIKFAERKSNSQLKKEAKERKELQKAEKNKKNDLKEKANARKEEKETKEGSQPQDKDENDIKRHKEMKNERGTDSLSGHWLDIQLSSKAMLDVTDSLSLRFDAPVDTIVQSGIHLEMMNDSDSTWAAVKNVRLVPADNLGVLRYNIPMLLTPGGKYRVTVDSLAVTSVYGLQNKPFKQDFSVNTLESYSNVYINVNVKDSAFAQLLKSSDEVVRTSKVVNGTVQFENITPATYYLRLIIDRNGNGKWDTGNYAKHQQPEEVYYYPKPFKLRKNWDVEQNWNIYETSVDKQKPEAIKKNRPEKSKNALDNKANNKKKKNNTDEEDNEDEFNSNGFSKGVYSGDKYKDYQNN